jgi:hypothetical protein
MFKTAIKRWAVLASMLGMSAVAFAGVTISSPASGSTTASPVHVVASASSTRPISAMTIYVDGVSKFNTYTNHLDTSLAVPTGTHLIGINAWDASGAVFVSTASINVSTSSAPPAGPAPGAAVHSEIQTMPGWASCTVCAGIGANGPVAGYSMWQNQTSPSLSGNSARFNIGGSTPYADAIWWKQLGADNGKTHFQYDLDFYLTAPQYAQALEFDANQSIGNTKFVFGTECNIRGDGAWDVWDTAGNAWRNTGIACTAPAAYQWHHLTWQFYRDSSSVHFVSLTLDGATHYVNRSYAAKPVSAQEVNVAFQMDGDYAMHSYSAWLDNVTLTAW